MQKMPKLTNELIMAAPTKDDFQEISDLLFRANERYRAVRATILLTIDATVAEEANRRFVDWRFAQGNPGMGIIGKPGPPVREDFYREWVLEGYRASARDPADSLRWSSR
jgi:hypothetical protein